MMYAIFVDGGNPIEPDPKLPIKYDIVVALPLNFTICVLPAAVLVPAVYVFTAIDDVLVYDVADDVEFLYIIATVP